MKNKKLLIYAILLAMAAAIVCYVCQSLPTKTEVRGIQVEIYGENNVNVKQYLENINYIDDYLIPYADKIVLTSNHVDIQAGTSKEEIVETANAVTVPQKKTMYINTNSYDSLTMMHEFFHLYDYHAKDGMISNDKEFQNVVKEELTNLQLSDYQLSSWSETFVGCMLQYRYFYEDMKTKCPQTFDYLHALITDVAK